MIGKLKIAAIAVFAAALGLTASASRAAVIVQSGDTYGGWTITLPAGISLVVDSVTSSTISIEKFAEFPSDAGLPIDFMQTPGTTAVPTIDIANEMVTNASGGGWSGFQFLIANVSEGLGSGAASFSGSTFVAPTGFTLGATSGTSITYTGSQANGTTSAWVFGSDAGSLIINANPSAPGTFGQDFVFKEQPLTNLVSLSSAAWQGLAGLLGLALVAGARNAKKLLA
jgi:hypothetical protein